MSKEKDTTTPANQGEQQTKLSAREQFMNDWGAEQEDLDMNDEDAVYGRMRQNWEDGKKRKEREDRFNSIMEQNNYAPEVMDAIMSGVGPEAKTANLIKLLAGEHREEFKAAIEGDEEALAFLAETRAKEIADEAAAANEAKAAEGKMAEAIQAQDEMLEKALAAAGKNPRDYEEYFNAIYDKENGLLVRACRFELKEEDFALLIKVADYDKNISAASEEGYRRGKNEKVDIYENLDNHGNGKPTNLGGGGNSQARQQPKNPTLQALDNMGRAY